MCLLLFAYQSHPDYQLILAANRDEFYDRPARAAAFWDNAPDILAGQDLKAGGTWMGITKTGRFAAITNYREAGLTKENAPSRGDLVKDFLRGDSRPHDYLKAVQEKGQTYNGFNLIIGDVNDLFYYSNRNENIHDIEPGVHGLSNRLLNTPWPKVKQGTARLRALITQKKGFSQEDIYTILGDRFIPPDEDLPDTGVGLEWERVLSPLFITSDIYGTRCTSILLWKNTGEITFVERTFDRPTGCNPSTTTQTYEFRLPTRYAP
jgi:uncharacterized protein with NRDE domain